MALWDFDFDFLSLMRKAKLEMKGAISISISIRHSSATKMGSRLCEEPVGAVLSGVHTPKAKHRNP